MRDDAVCDARDSAREPVSAPPSEPAPGPFFDADDWGRGSLAEAVPGEAKPAAKMAGAAAVLRSLAADLLEDRAGEGGFVELLDWKVPRLSAVRPVRLRYWSEDARGRPVLLSGMLYLPERGPGADLPLLLFNHGTELRRDKVPSLDAAGDCFLAKLVAATGVAVAMPDYAGLGDSQGRHPFCHAESLARDGVDIVAAARAYLARRGPGARADSGRLYAMGYSEGGYATMAQARAFAAADDRGGLRAAFPMAGPFDTTGGLARLARAAEGYGAPFFLIYLALGWHSAYGDAFSPARVLRDEYLDRVVPLMNGRAASSTVDDAIRAVQGGGEARVSALYKGEFLERLKAMAPGDPLTEACAENDIWDWAPPPDLRMHLMASPTDELVFFESSDRAHRAFLGHGASSRLTALGQEKHADAAMEALLLATAEIWRMEDGA